MFCEWAKDGDEVRRRHVCNRSRVGPGPATPPAAPAPGPEPPPRKPIPLVVARKLLRTAHAECFYATRCGCAGGGARCHHLGRIVTLHDCAGCLES